MDIPDQTLRRILDANLDRAREGLRVIEEWCRFGLQDSRLTDRCKQLRQQLAGWHTAELRLARDTTTDPGTTLTHLQEEQRENLQALLQANLSRVQESLRVLEEYGKLYDPFMGKELKQMRYQVYVLESQLLNRQRLQTLCQAPLYLVTSPLTGESGAAEPEAAEHRLLKVVELALQAGLRLVQYRDKEAKDETRWTLATKLSSLCHQYDALFLINDRVDLALAVDADGVHLGQQDLPIAVARELLGPQRIIGRSTTNPEEMQRAIAEGADYLGVGPVYATPTKAGKAPAGLTYVRYAAEHSTLPWYAIGGIDSHNLEQVLGAGATRVAVVRAIMEAEAPDQVVKNLLAQLAQTTMPQPSIEV